jgi:dihydrofolate reductase
MTRIALVAAVSRNGVIGRDGTLPWAISSELKRFKAITMGKPIIMGRKTWDSLPRKPLPGRHNIVITRQPDFGAEGATIVSSRDAALEAAGAVEETAVIGGGEIYAMFLPLASRLYLTEVDLEVEGDAKFPHFDKDLWMEVSAEHHAGARGGDIGYTLRVLDRRA